MFFEQEHFVEVPRILEGAQGDIVYGDAAFTDETDVVLIMDESGSMAFADKERIAVEAAKMFIDMEKPLAPILHWWNFLMKSVLQD